MIFIKPFCLLILYNAIGYLIAGIEVKYRPKKDFIIVMWMPETDPSTGLNEWNRLYGQTDSLVAVKLLSEELSIGLYTFFQSDTNRNRMEMLRRFRQVRLAQWDAGLSTFNIPDDPHYSSQWYLHQIGAEDIWKNTTGGITASGDSIVVAVIDIGFNIFHPELAGQIWHNHQEVPGDFVDNDKNGYTDDISGWNFRNNSPHHQAEEHGNAVLGIIGAKGNNNSGICGVNWNIRLLPCSAGTISELIEAYLYILELRTRFNLTNGKKGALVASINASVGISGATCKDYPIWGLMIDKLGEAGVLSVYAAGNEGKNTDIESDMPSNCNSPFLLNVAASDKNGRKAAFSSYGAFSADLSAPGVDIRTISINDYKDFSGTSASTPLVSAAIALLYSIPCDTFAGSIADQPVQTALAVRNALLKGVNPMPQGNTVSKSGGTIHLMNSYQILENHCSRANAGNGIVKIFPNPSSGYIELHYLKQHPDLQATFNICDMTGRIVFTDTESPENPWNPGIFYINTAFLPAGFYFIICNIDGLKTSEMIQIAE